MCDPFIQASVECQDSRVMEIPFQARRTENCESGGGERIVMSFEGEYFDLVIYTAVSLQCF